MNTVKYRALAKDGTWRYGCYPCLNVDMGNTRYPMDIFWNSFLSTFRRETLGQFTGLLDKQGKEIYEGDIVRYLSAALLNGFCLASVVFHNGSFMQRFVEADGFSDDACDNYFEWDEVEVIGNIYESKSLLERVDQ